MLSYPVIEHGHPLQSVWRDTRNRPALKCCSG